MNSNLGTCMSVLISVVLTMTVEKARGGSCVKFILRIHYDTAVWQLQAGVALLQTIVLLVHVNC